ncbi:MAG: hypothetical protein KDI81_10845 [Xanthomonadales bacterium]|nr:hypothetical protein [Xanthomonadales bacterium]
MKKNFISRIMRISRPIQEACCPMPDAELARQRFVPTPNLLQTRRMEVLILSTTHER